MNQPRPLHGDTSRQAVPSFTGAAYQAWLSIDAWLRLRDDDEVIFLEGAEDFDLVGGRGPDTAFQAKHTGGSISLGNAKAREALENFWLLAEREPERLVHMHYLTTSSPAQERDGDFGGLHGIDAWRAARTSPRLASSVAQYVAGKLNAGSALRQFLETASPDALQERLFKRFHWYTDQPGIGVVQRSVDDRLTTMLVGLGRSPRLVAQVRPHLESQFWATVTQPDQELRRLTKGGLVRALDEAMTAYLPVPVERAGEVLGLSAPGAALLSLLRDKVPTPPSPLLPRAVLVQALRAQIDQRKAVLLTGSIFKGKTTVAQLVAGSLCPDAWWLPLRGRSLDQVDTLLLALAREVDADTAPALIIIDDLEVSADAYRMVETSVSLVVHRAIASGRGVVLTAQGSPTSAQAFSAVPHLHIVDVPELSEGEIQDLCVSGGCPPASARAVAFVIHARTRGHPKLVQIRLAELSKEGWATPELSALTGESPGIESTRHLSRQLLSRSVTPPLAELVYAAADGTVLLHRTVMLALAEGLRITNPGDAVDALNGTWLESIETHWFRVTPLLQGVTTEVWTESRRRENHLLLHNAILSKGTLDPAEAAALLYHAYHSKLPKLIALNAMRLQVVEDADAQRAVLRNLFWLPFVALTAEEPIAGDQVSSAAARSIQFRVAVALDSATLPAICERWVEETDRLPADEIRSGMRAMMWSSLLAAESKKVPLGFRLAAIEKLPDVGGEIGEVVRRGLRDAFSGRGLKLGIPSNPDLLGLMLFLATRWVRDVTSMRVFVSWLDERASNSIRTAFEAMLDWPFVQSMGAVVHGAWASKHEDTVDWQPWLEVFNLISDYARRRSSPRFGIEAAKAKSIVLSEHLGRREAAMDVLSEAQTAFGDSVVLEEQRANVLFQGEDDEGVLRLWNDFENAGRSGALNDPYAYRRAGISAARLQRWSLSADMFNTGASKADGSGFELTRFGMLADSALSRFYGGQIVDAASSLCAAVRSLPAEASKERELRWEAVQRVAYEIVVLIDKSTSGKEPGERKVRPGDVSSPAQKMEKTEPGQEFRTLSLRVSTAKLAARHGLISSELEGELANLHAAPYRFIRLGCAESRVALSLAQGGAGFADALCDYDRALAEIFAVGADRTSLLARDTPLSTSHLSTGLGWEVLILAAAWCSGAELGNRLAQWEAGLKASGLSVPAERVNQLASGMTGASVELAASMGNTGLDPLARCGAALALLATEQAPTERLRLQDFLLSGLKACGNEPLQELWNLAVARFLAGEWKPFLQHRFHFVRPRETVPVLGAAIDGVVRGAGSIRTIQGALHAALGMARPAYLITFW